MKRRFHARFAGGLDASNDLGLPDRSVAVQEQLKTTRRIEQPMVSPEAEWLKQRFVEFSGRLSGCGTVAEMRALFRTFADITAQPAGVTWVEVNAGGIPAIWADADGGAKDRVLLFLHGGGYVIGDARSYQHFTGHLAKAVGCRVLCVDYRLAPEHPHPAPLTDVTSAYGWLLGQGWQPAHLAIAGDSAGGGLTLATLLALRDAGTPLPAALVPISPWVDLEATGDTMTSNAEYDVMVQRASILGMAALFLNGHDAKDPLAAPVHADFTGLPPMYIQVGGHETLLDDARRVTSAARSAGVNATLEVFPEMQHVFQFGAGRVPESDEALAKIGAFLRSRLGLLAQSG